MSGFKESVTSGKEFIVTCEFVPGRGTTGPAIEEVVKFGEKVVSSGLPIHALSLTDNPGGNPAISPDVLAGELKAVGMESLVHISCAGINRNTIESRVSGLFRKGLKNLLIITGDYPEGGYKGIAKPVFDLDSVQALKYLKDLNSGIELPGKKKDGTPNRLGQTDFFLACGFNPFGKSEGELVTQFIKLEKKVAAGADLIIPNLGYDIRKFAEIKKYLSYRNINLPLFGNCYVLSRPVARIMNKREVAGCVVSDELLRAIEQEAEGADKGKQARLDRAAQLTAMFRGMGLNGVHIGGFGLKFEDYEFIIKQSETLAPKWREFIPNFNFSTKNDFYLFPEDPQLTFANDSLIPASLPKKHFFSMHYAMSRMTHHLVFTEGTPGFALGKSVYKTLEKHKAMAGAALAVEHTAKSMLYDCQECGDCALFNTSYLCPMSQCRKSQRNGPCGGSKNNMCEVDDTKECIWYRAYARLTSTDDLSMIEEYVPPVNNALYRTSSWGNYFLGKDHTGKDSTGQT